MAVSPSNGMYSFTFDTKAEYLAAKASGGVIYAALVNSTEVTVSAVSYIKELSQTVTDIINPIVDRKYGEVGDALLYKDGTFYWNKAGNGSWSSTSLGSQVYVASRLSDYTLVGYMAAKSGTRATIMKTYVSSAKWRNTANSADGFTLYSSISRRFATSSTRLYNYTSGVINYDLAYNQYPSTNAANAMPITKAQWDEICGYAKAGTDVATTTATYYSYSVTSGVATITVTVGSTTVTVDPADYDYDFKTWYNEFIPMQYPCHRMAASDMDGRGNTDKLLAAGDSPAATAVNAFGISEVTGFEAGDWWMPSFGEILPMLQNTLIIRGRGIYFNGNTHVCTARTASQSYYVNFGSAQIASNSKTTARQSFPITYFSLV